MWGNGKTVEDVHETMLSKIQTSNEVFAYYRAVFIEKLLSIIWTEDTKEVEQQIQASIVTINRIRTNDECKTTYTNIKKKCSKCGSKVVKNTVSNTGEKSSASTENGKSEKYEIYIVFYK